MLYIPYVVDTSEVDTVDPHWEMVASHGLQVLQHIETVSFTSEKPCMGWKIST